MTRRRKIEIAVAATLLVAIVATTLLLVRPLRRRPLFPGESGKLTVTERMKKIELLPQEQWTPTFIALAQKGEWDLLDAHLEKIRTEREQDYGEASLAYLHARVRSETGDHRQAQEMLAPFLVAGNPLRDLALYHAAEAARAGGDDEKAAQFRTQLIREEPQSRYRAEAIEDQIDYFAEEQKHAELVGLAGELRPGASSALRRELDGHVIVALLRQQKGEEVFARAKQLLSGGVGDDAANRVAAALAGPARSGALDPELLLLVARAKAAHREYQTAIELLRASLQKTPARRDELVFAIGRAHFGAEEYDRAREVYEQGAGTAATPEQKATFLFHASRAAQLQGADADAERLMTQAIAVPGRFSPTSAALTQRMRTRLQQKRFADARADLDLLRKLFPQGRGLIEASISYASAALAAGRAPEAVAVLDAIPRGNLDPYDRPEIAYWRGRAKEASDPPGAVSAYLDVVSSTAATHFAYFAEARLREASLQPVVRQAIERRRALVRDATDPREAAARQKEIIALSEPAARSKELAALQEIYGKIPEYRRVLELAPHDFPRFPLSGASRTDLLMAMGLFDDAANAFSQRYSLQDGREALTQSLAFHYAGASRESILAVEVMMRRVPDDFARSLLPRQVLELLYPRYFHDTILRESSRHDADPRLVLSIMREESRFNPRARSVAAARGLLQFIITTARDVARQIGIASLEPSDLYDPQVIIQLGAKYIGSLSSEFDGNHYSVAAAYNAGPNQTRLWRRLSPAPGDDFFHSSVNFDETKHYVRKVMNSYRRYQEIYGDS